MTADLDRKQGGFTLIELMIALVLFSVAVGGVLSVAVSVTQGIREQRQAVQAEASVRAPLDFLADAIRQSSPGVSDPSKVQDFHTCVTGAITVTNSSTGPDELDLFYATGGFYTSLYELFDTSSGTTMKVYDASKLAIGDYVLVTDFTVGMLAKITNIAGTSAPYTLTLGTRCGSLTWPASGNFPASSIVIRAQHAHFSIGTVEGVTTLLMDPDGSGSAPAEPLAEGIEDMQIALGIDSRVATPGLQTIGAAANDDDWDFNKAGDTATTGTVRAVRITLIAQTVTALAGNQTTFFNRPAAEDRAAGASDNFRRRVLTTTVELRNTNGSP